MTLRRAAVYVGGASLLVAWLASAASLSFYRSPRRPAADAQQPISPVDNLASQVQQQSARLRARLAASPRLEPSVRNPFAFRTVLRPPSAPARRLAPAAPEAAPAEPPEPALSLIGIAEDNGPQGLVRTAMLVTAGDELLMVTIGDSVLQRYTVTAIGPDAIEFADQATGRTRRLVLPFLPQPLAQLN